MEGNIPTMLVPIDANIIEKYGKGPYLVHKRHPVEIVEGKEMPTKLSLVVDDGSVKIMTIDNFKPY